MTKIELNTLRNGLKNRQAELENGNRSREALVIEGSPDELDRIQYGQERDLAIDILDRNSELLRELTTKERFDGITVDPLDPWGEGRGKPVHKGIPRVSHHSELARHCNIMFTKRR